MRLWTFDGASNGLNRDRTSHTGLITEWAPGNSEAVGIGDVNGDGLEDAVFEYRYSGNRMRLFSFLGSSSGIVRENRVNTGLVNEWDASRSESVGLGDTNGDGYEDAVFEYNYGGNRMRLWSFFGANNGLNRDRTSHTGVVGEWDATRSDAAGVEDVNGDGLDDVVTEYGYSGSRMRLFTWFGTIAGLNNNNKTNTGLVNEWDADRSEL